MIGEMHFIFGVQLNLLLITRNEGRAKSVRSDPLNLFADNEGSNASYVPTSSLSIA